MPVAGPPLQKNAPCGFESTLIALKAGLSEPADRLLQQCRQAAIIGGMDDMYTLDGLKRAQEDLDRWRDKWGDSNSNFIGPGSYRPNRDFRVLSSRGFPQLEDEMMEFLVWALDELPEPEGDFIAGDWQMIN
jgi:hypothetical protein